MMDQTVINASLLFPADGKALQLRLTTLEQELTEVLNRWELLESRR